MNVETVASRAAMAARSPSVAGDGVLLTEAGREGLFICRAGTPPDPDPQQGLYVPSTSDPSLYYAREWDQVTGLPEWFGAYPNNGDCLPGLQAAILLCPVLQLRNDDYYISSTWKINTPRRTVRGVSGRAQGRFEGTRLVVLSGVDDVMQVGPDTPPDHGVNAFLASVRIESLSLSRTPLPYITAQDTDQPMGLRCQYIISCFFDRVFAAQNAMDFYFGGIVSSFISNCSGLRSSSSTGPFDFYYGLYLDGTLPNVGSGGNASIYLDKCSSIYAGGVSGDVIGMTINGAFADTFVRDFEVAGHKRGMLVVGTGAGGIGKGNIDLLIDHPILDQCTVRGLEIAAVAPGGIVVVNDAYAALARTADAFACFHVHDGAGSIVFNGGQAICLPNSEVGGNALGFFAQNQSGVVVSRTVVSESIRPCGFDACTNCDLTPEIENLTYAVTQAAVVIGSSSLVRVAPRISGSDGIFPAGVDLAGLSNARVEVNWTRIDDDATSANRLTVNAATVAATGPFPGGVVYGA